MANGTGSGLRALKLATMAMGVLILVGTAVIVVTIVKRTISGPLGSGPLGSGPLGSGPAGLSEKAFAAVLDEPAGTAIAGITSVRDRLAVQLHGGGADRVVLIDPASGAVVGRVGLAR